MEGWPRFKKAKPFLEMQPIKVRIIGETSSAVRTEESNGELPKLKCLFCKETKTVVGKELGSAQMNTAKVSLRAVKEIFGGEHDFYCCMHRHLHELSENCTTSQKEMREEVLGVKKHFESAVPSSQAVFVSCPAILDRWKFSRLNAVKRQLQFRVRKGLALPIAKKLAGVMFFDSEGKNVSSWQIAFAEAARRAVSSSSSKNGKAGSL